MAYRPSSPSSTTSTSCVTTNSAGFPYEPLPCLYPDTIGRTYTPWELSYDPVPIRDYMTSHPQIPLLATALYLLFIVSGRWYMSNRKPYSWRTTLAMWNFTLSVFSLAGMLRTAPHLAHNLIAYGWRDCLCGDPESLYGSGPTGLWVQLFVLSKFPELADTIFIIVHKKPLLFLHWYHHFTVLLYCWHSYVHKAPAGLFFVVMNYTVHFVMYGYYFLMAVKMKPEWMNAMFITAMQISQMVFGVFVTVLSFHYYQRDDAQDADDDDPCLIRSENNTAAFVMYGSYLILFLQFFVGRYFRKSEERKEVTSGTDKEMSKSKKRD